VGEEGKRDLFVEAKLQIRIIPTMRYVRWSARRKECAASTGRNLPKADADADRMSAEGAHGEPWNGRAIGWTMRDMICSANQRRRAIDGARNPSSIHRILCRNDHSRRMGGFAGSLRILWFILMAVTVIGQRGIVL
jgi:hypothetical protein